MEKIIEIVSGVLQKYTDLCGGEFSAAFSGGADSTALLCIMLKLREKYGFKLRALTVNYNLRGEESIRDRDFCEYFCLENNVEFHSLEVDSRKLSDKSENALREIRYKWFESFDGFVLTAHTADDNAETLLLNLFRGTGLSGLMAIPERRGKFIRPLLSVKKSQLEDLLYEIGQNFVTDSSNFTDDYTRNQIRNRIIPEIRLLVNTSFTDATVRLIASLKADNEFLEAETEKYEDFANAPQAIRLRKLKKFFTHNNLSLDYNKISMLDNAISDKKRVKIAVGKDLYVVYRPGGEVSLETKKDYDEPEIPVTIGKTVNFCDKRITFLLKSAENLSESEIVHIKLTQNAFDYDIINGIAIAALRKNGDSYRRVNRLFDSRLKTLYNENLSPEERANNIVLRDSDGIIWCEHFGCADRVKITENTKNIMIIEVEPL